MTNWAALQHAYGSAQDLPRLLAAAAADTGHDREVWEQLWGRICHQGTVYSASYAALPALATIAERRAPAGYVEPLHLAAAIIGSTDGPEDAADVRRRYAAELSTCRDLAERNLELADGFVEYVYGLQALMALEGIPIWQNRLQSLADEELELYCPNCGEDLYLGLAGPEFKATVAFPDGPSTATPIIPADPIDLQDGAARMHALALRHGQTDVAAKMLYMLGRAICPLCGGNFQIPSALAENRPQDG